MTCLSRSVIWNGFSDAALAGALWVIGWLAETMLRAVGAATTDAAAKVTARAER